VCVATSGPGATNLVTGIADAMLDSVPMVAITGQVPTHLMGTDAFQEVDVFGMTLPMVKHSFIVRDAIEDRATVRGSLPHRARRPPGPVLIDLPKDVPPSDRCAALRARRIDAGPEADRDLAQRARWR
jgi:acetolactate synthase-1/2/3 large subunit